MQFIITSVFLVLLTVHSGAPNQEAFETLKELPCEAGSCSIREKPGIANQPTGFLLNTTVADDKSTNVVLSFSILKPINRGDVRLIGIDAKGNQIRPVEVLTGDLNGDDVRLVQMIARFKECPKKLLLQEKVIKKRIVLKTKRLPERNAAE